MRRRIALSSLVSAVLVGGPTWATVVAVPDSGTGTAGAISRPIANVAANDTVNGTPATLGTGGNATVSKAGAWPTGLALNLTTGAVSSSATVPIGVYSIPYVVCNSGDLTDCATVTDTVSVIAVSIQPVADSGVAIAGIASMPIANVLANDTVNGAPATLGATGNAILSKVGTWPTGFSVLLTSGAIYASTAITAGTFQLPYQLCDRLTPARCATTTATVTVAPNFKEVMVTTTYMPDIEFDWGRDGLFCATCNFGEGNARFNWTDPYGNLWVGHIDPTAGAFTPTMGNNELADTTAFNYSAFGNGPEWAFSTQNGQVISQLVYTRWTPGVSPTSANAYAAFSTPGPTGWTATFFPGVTSLIGSNGQPVNTVLPVASQCNSDPVALTQFSDLATPSDAYWEQASTVPGNAPTLTPFGTYLSSISGDKLGIRWVPCTHQLLFIGSAPPDDTGTVYKQVFWYDTDTQVVQQLTFDPNQHGEAFMFQAPEFGDAYVFFATTPTEIDVYEETGIADNGSPIVELINQITSPDPAEPNIDSTEPFVHCTPTCQSYIFMTLRPAATQDSRNLTLPMTGLAVTNINPAQPLFKVLIPGWATPTIARTDPEYYITANGAYLYYLRLPTNVSKTGGRFYIDMQLGAPSGPCVGSSAEGGLLPGC